MIEFKNLLSFGFIPPELPSCFTSKSFGEKSETVKNILIDKDNGEIGKRKKKSSKPISFSGYKSDVSRRNFSIANPLHFAVAAYEISENNNELFELFDNNSISISKPINKKCNNNGFARTSNSVLDTKRELKKLYRDNLFELRLDIQSFFGSIYTHSIAWALHSKKAAKANRKDEELLGNRLDQCMQNLNDGQTNGILIGNDVSRIISEIILCAIDEKLNKRFDEEKLKEVSFKRFVDDYYFFTRTRKDVDSIIAIMQQELTSYELELNASKVMISRSPLVFDNAFISEIKGCYGLEPIEFLEHVIQSYSVSRDIRILKYGLRTIENVGPFEDIWSEMEPYILNIWVSCPSLANLVVPLLVGHYEKINRRTVKGIINSIIDDNMLIGNDQEVIWAMWGAMQLRIQLAQVRLDHILQSDNYLAIIIALDMIAEYKLKQKRRIKSALNTLRSRLENEYFSGGSLDGMYSEIWILAYEATRNKWLNTSGKDVFDKAKKEPFFQELLKEDVFFYYRDRKVDLENTDEASSAAIKPSHQSEQITNSNNGNLLSKRSSKTLSELIAEALGY